MFLSKFGIKAERKQKLLKFQKQAGLKFKDLSLLDLAFHHRSYSNERKKKSANNERLEFLGDSVLGLVVASYIYHAYSEKSEGDLAKIKASVVSEDSLSNIAHDLGISQYLILGRGEEMSGGRNKKAILADTVEAIIGAVYLDAGFKVAQKFVLKLLSPVIQDTAQKKVIGDSKSLLQELVQKKFKSTPRYVLTKVSGPDHDKTFWFSVEVNKKKYGPLSGKTKKEAEQAVAKLAYEDISSKN